MIKKSRFVLAMTAVLALAFAALAYADGASDNQAFVDGQINKPQTKPKLDKKKYKPVNLFSGVRTDPANTGPQSNIPQSEVLDYSNDIKFNLKSTPVCPGLPPNGSTPEQAKAACPNSFLGSGTAEVEAPDGSKINDIIVSLFHGGPGNAQSGPAKENAILLHTYSPTLGTGSPTVNGEVNNAKAGKGYGWQLSVTQAPNTAPLEITSFNANVMKSSKSVLARCKDKTITFRRTVTYTDGSKDVVTTTQKCKRKPEKKHHHGGHHHH